MIFEGPREDTKAWCAGEEVVITSYPAVVAYRVARLPQDEDPPYMSTFFPLGLGVPVSEGLSRPRWMVRADTTVARLMMVVAPASRVTEGGSLDVVKTLASAYLWKAPKR